MPTFAIAATPARRRAALVLLVAAVAYGLGGYPLLDPDEGRNAEVARETWTSGQPLVPHLNGLPYLDKPVLFFAVDAVAQKFLGADERAARLPSLLWSLATAALTAWAARRWFGGDAAWIGGVAALATPLAVVFARVVIFDAQLAFFVSLSLLAFHEAIEARAESRPGGRRWTALAWAAMGLGVLTKGPVALAVPLLVALPYGLWRRAGRAVFSLLGSGLFLALVVPWVVVMVGAVPDYLHYALVAETWQRLTTGRFERTGPPWFFLPCLLLGALPWSFVVLASLRRAGRAAVDRRQVFLWLWIVLPLLLFSLSQSKRPQYVLPLLPALALSVAGAWSRERQVGGRLPGARAGAAAWMGWGLLLLAGGVLLPGYRGLPADHLAALCRFAWSWGAVAVAAGGVGWWAAGRRGVALAALALPAAVLPLLLAPALAEVGPDFSARRLAAAIGPGLTPEVEVVGLRAYPPSLPFYLRRTLTVVGPRGRELTSNYIIHSFPHWLRAPGTTLRPLAGWPARLAACAPPALYVVHAGDTANRAVLAAAGLPRRYADGRFAAYGPCLPPGAAP